MTTTKTAPNYTPYVPLAVRQWLNAEDPEEKHRVIEGSTLFADISGFTKLSERLDRIGREGAEQVTEVIGNAFNRLLEPAYAYGGQLIKFGGDALLIFYRGDDHELLASSSALQMRAALRAMGPIETPAGRVTLRMSQGVHSGEFHFFLVGDTFKELIMAGTATSHVGNVEGEANAGQIIVSNETARALPAKNLGTAKTTGRLLRGDLLPLEESTQSVYAVEDDLAPFIPSALRELIASDAVTSEHRPSTNAFIRFTGVDALLEEDPETVTVAFEELINDVEAATRRRSIAVLNTDVYPDGLKILLSAGAPITTGEDEENMLLALREIVSKERPLPLHIGVTRGPVFAGDVGTTFRRGYTVMGDQVNLAARLMSRAAPNQILATDPVLQRSRTIFGTSELEPFYVKGKSKPVIAFVVGEARGARADASGEESPFLGRDEELDSLSEIWERTQEGAGSLVLVGGDPGTGKSRLVAEFIDAVGAHHVYSATGRRYRQATPYFAATMLLSEALGIDRYHPEGQEERLLEVVAEAAPELMPYKGLIGTALGLDIPESQAELALAPEFRKGKLEETVVALLSALLTGPTVVCIDDAQYADDASADLLKAIAIATADRPWMLIASGRKIERAADARDVTAPTIILGPLSAEDATAIVHACTDDAPLAPHVTAAIVERAQGNPMFLHQLLASIDEGDIDAMPESIEGVVTARIDGLPPEDRNALRQLSVLGIGFRPEFAGVVLSEPASPAVFKRLSMFLDVEPKWVKFSNGLIHQAAYGGLPYRQRRTLHGNVADSIERSGGGADLLSVHYHAAGRWQEAWENSMAAGDRAKDIFANIEAAALYQRAIDSAKRSDDVPDGEHAGALESLGDVRDLAGLYEESSTAYRGARKLAKGEPMDEARLALKQSFLQEHQGHLPQALRWIRSGHKSLDGISSDDANATRAQLTVWYGAIRARQGRFKDALSWAMQGVEEASLADDQRAVARAYLIQDYAEFALGLSREPEYSLKALAIYEEVEDFAGVGTAASNIGGYTYFAGRWDDARKFYEQSEEAKRKIGDPVNTAVASSNIAEILSDQGHVVEAERLLREARRVFQSSNDPWDLAFTERLLGLALSRQHRFAEADELFESAGAGFDLVGAAEAVVENDLRRIESLVSRRATDEAFALIGQTVDSVDPSEGLGPFQATLHRLWGEALIQTDSLDEARTHLEAAEASAREEGADFELALTISALARLDEHEGRPQRVDPLHERDAILEQLGVETLVDLAPEPV